MSSRGMRRFGYASEDVPVVSNQRSHLQMQSIVRDAKEESDSRS